MRTTLRVLVARVGWLAVASASAIVVVSAVSAPIIQSFLGYPTGESIYTALSDLCHQYPTRSLWIFDRPTALCARCLFGYTGVVFASIYVVLHTIGISRKNALIAFVLLATGVIDAAAQLLLNYESTNLLRSVTGFLGGIGAVFLSYILLSIIGGNNARTKTAS